MVSSRQLSSRLEALEAQTSGAVVSFDRQKFSADHPKQLAFMGSKARQRTACCSRRAGKSEGCAGLLLDTATQRAGCVALYLTKTRINAKRIIWSVLKRINREHQLGGNAKEAELCMEFPNGSAIYLGGVNTKDEIEKFRGLPIAIVVIDESQAVAGYLQQLVDEVLAAALMDYDGSIVLVGTPAPVPAGYFYDCIKNPEWEHHDWTVFDNPWIERKSGKTPQQHLEAECQRRGIKPDDPIIQREYFGRWVYDPNSLVFRYEQARNHYDALPDSLPGDWECVIGGDIGWDDADALAVLAWNTTRPDLYLKEEHVLPKQTITQLGDLLRKLVDQHKPLAVVLDFGGLGKKIAAELTQRWSLKVEAAEKERKLEHIELLNDSMRTGHLFAKKDSRFAQDCMLVEWDKSNPEKPKISDRFHSDVCDAVLYGHRRAKQWVSEPEQERGPRPGSREWQAAQAAKQAEQMEAEMEREIAEQTERWQEKQDNWDDAEEFI